MLLKKITLENFRPFKGYHEMLFSTNEDKNVTLVLAENGAGKTTLAQAFQWVLYSTTDGFNNKSLLNTLVENDMALNSSVEVKVSLELEHRGIDYTINRTQVYRKDANGIVKPDSPKLAVIEKDKYGQSVFHTPNENMSIINSILPSSLSKYFFFDGERIENMSKEVSGGRSTEFKDAVQNLLGLNALNKAIEHLKPTSSNSVIGRYNAQIDADGSQQAKEYRNKVYMNQEKIEKNNARIDELESQITFYKKQIEDFKNQLLSFRDVENQQRELNALNNDLKNLRTHKNESIGNFAFQFSSTTYKYLSRKLIKDALEELKKTDNIDNGIPDIRNTTIEYLMKKKKCICGQDLSDEHGEHVQELIRLLKFIPPQSLGNAINSFSNASKNSLRNSTNYYDNLIKNFSAIRGFSNEIDAKEHQIGKIDATILSNQNATITDIKNSQLEFESTLARYEKELENLRVENGVAEREIKNANYEISKLELKVQKNSAIEIQRKYAQAAYDMINSAYVSRANKTRETLEDEINKLFEKIYDGGMTINIDDKYRIQTFVDELKTSSAIDNNTAKSYSIIFAFIVGVIKMAKDKANGASDGIDNITNTDYPLVMDAPLSSFDQKRIKNICEVIPGIARQVIIFIKDTDGNIAKEHLMNRVGIEYDVTLRTPPKQIDSIITRRGDN